MKKEIIDKYVNNDHLALEGGSEKPIAPEALEEEIERQLDVFPYAKVTPELPESRLILIQKQLRPFARHFAEWGAEHLKK